MYVLFLSFFLFFLQVYYLSSVFLFWVIQHDLLFFFLSLSYTTRSVNLQSSIVQNVYMCCTFCPDIPVHSHFSWKRHMRGVEDFFCCLYVLSKCWFWLSRWCLIASQITQTKACVVCRLYITYGSLKDYFSVLWEFLNKRSLWWVSPNDFAYLVGVYYSNSLSVGALKGHHAVYCGYVTVF